MTLKLLTLSGILAVASAATAAPIPVLTFDGLTNGAQIQSYYNGGTDSLGNVGFNYGVTFDGGTVQVANGLTYLTNVSGVHVAGGFPTGVSFNYSTLQTPFNSNGAPAGDPGANDFYSYSFDINGNIVDANFLGNTTTGFCQAFTNQFCLFAGARETANTNMLLSGFTFSPRAAIDTITFGSVAGVSNEFATSVPEPTTTALFGLGLFGFVVARRRLKK